MYEGQKNKAPASAHERMDVFNCCDSTAAAREMEPVFLRIKCRYAQNFGAII
jgi:hypothetical protein